MSRQGSTTASSVQMEIFDQFGNEILMMNYDDDKGLANHQIKVNNLASGIYSVRFTYDGKSHTKRFIKTNE